ncbi:hypothetical protein ACTXJX_17395 [Glutamicibacter ardleyensis]|uniref:hypothetical protein n=1 Tax=Glutamicibacter ardleyensis TaxID=225894 RepID=UPI003FD6A690
MRYGTSDPELDNSHDPRQQPKKAVRAYAEANGLKYCEAQRQLAGTDTTAQSITYKAHASSTINARLIPEHTRANEEQPTMNRTEWLAMANQHLKPLHMDAFSTDEFWNSNRHEENPVIQISIRGEWWRERPLKPHVIDQVLSNIPEATADIVDTLKSIREDDVFNAEDEGESLEQFVGFAVPNFAEMTNDAVIAWWKTLGKDVYSYTDFDTTGGLQTDWEVTENIVMPAIVGTFHGTHGTSMELNLDYRNTNPDTLLELFKQCFPGLEQFIDTMLT